jgi:DNA polymerase
LTAPSDGRREAVLREMGLAPLWRLRTPPAAVGQEAGLAGEALERPATTVVGLGAPDSFATVAAREAEAPLSARPTSTPIPVSLPLAGSGRSARAERIARLDWDALEADIHACRECVLGSGRQRAVPGVGDRRGRWMLVGEGPGAEEDRKGEPFVGQAGRLLDNMLAAIGRRRGEDVYIANAVKCRPPHNRTPEPAEIASCLPYLQRQIELVHPSVLIALGRPAAQALLAREVSIAAARGQRFDYHGIPVVVTYHPAYLLRNPQDKAKAWEDLCFARRLIAEAEQRAAAAAQ